MRRPLGCMTLPALIAAAIALIAVGVAWAWRGGALFSPGPLNAQAGDRTLGGVRSHAELERQCSACHTAPWSPLTMSDRCLFCHTDIAAELREPDSLHANLMQDPQHAQCQDCHPEHRGPDAPLTVLDVKNFPHEATGFSLRAHQRMPNGAPFVCQDCHTQSLAEFDQGECERCHQQVTLAFVAHVQTFGTDCLACHDGIDTYGADFDHGRATGFPLEGGHARAICADCHEGARTLADLRATPSECVACHEDDDVHDGRFGPNCQVCHSPVAWDQVTFDHDLTAFPLEGAHAELECSSCHLNDVYRGTPTECAACHSEPDYHRGMFSQACEQCHNATAWRPARYDEPHTFPMNHGRRSPSECQVCHPTTLREYTCYGCHEHTPQNIAAEHREEGIFNFDNCVECHPTGREEEAEFEYEDDD